MFGIPAAQLQAILLKVRALSQPFGAADLRPAGQRRLDVLVDLLLGRIRPGDEHPDDETDGRAETDPFGPAPVVRHCGPGAAAGSAKPCRAG